MAKKLVKGCTVIVHWLSSHYRGYVPPSEATYLGKVNGKYKVEVAGRGVAYLPKKMIKVK